MWVRPFYRIHFLSLESCYSKRVIFTIRKKGYFYLDQSLKQTNKHQHNVSSFHMMWSTRQKEEPSHMTSL